MNKMIRLNKPQMEQSDIIDICTSNMREGEKKQKLCESKEEIVKMSKQYDSLAECGELLDIVEKDKSESGASKSELISLYDDKFSKKGQLARKYYDEIILLAPNGRCPQCGQRQVKNLDHYLPKSKYPLLAVVPYNLVPCCSECNKNKLDKVPYSREMETIHPYYDDFDDQVWIKAIINEQDPLSFEFYACKPEGWSELKYKRAKNHFITFGLNELYKPYAAEMVITEIGWIKRLLQKCGEDVAKQEILDRMADEQKIRKNTWKAAIYEAIYNNEWFWKQYLPNYG